MPWHFLPGKARTGYVVRTAAVVVAIDVENVS